MTWPSSRTSHSAPHALPEEGPVDAIVRLLRSKQSERNALVQRRWPLTNQLKLTDVARAPTVDVGHGLHGLGHDIAYLRLSIVNAVFIGPPDVGDKGWILVDTGLATSAKAIREAAARRFGASSTPASIILTHGHFDHVGSAETLAREWDVPIYAHPLELPYLDGSTAYPPADPWVGGGIMALLSPFYPREPVDLGGRLRLLPENGSVPGAPGWQWIHTPGHASGHVSLWRASDRVLVAGDAVITTGQESAYEVIVQQLEMHGPPRYFTPDWKAAGQSAKALADLNPNLIITGHGAPAAGEEMREALKLLARDFEHIAVPSKA